MRVSRVQTATSFQTDKQIVLTFADGLKRLEKALSGKLQLINVPDYAPPDAPRAMIKSANTLISIGLNRIDIHTNPPQHIASKISSIINFAKSRADQVFESITIEDLGYSWSGCVAFCDYPGNNKVDVLSLMTPVFDSLITISRNNLKLSTFEIKFGFIETDVNRNYNITGYEKKHFQAQISQIKKLVISQEELNSLPTIENGIQVVVDLNNKPQKQKINPKSDLKFILEKMELEIDKIPQILNLVDILK